MYVIAIQGYPDVVLQIDPSPSHLSTMRSHWAGRSSVYSLPVVVDMIAGENIVRCRRHGVSQGLTDVQSGPTGIRAEKGV